MSDWKPIESAPKDGGSILLYCPLMGVCVGYYIDNKMSKRPRPYWSHVAEQIHGIRAIRDDQPTHWKLLPEPPLDEGK